VRDALVRRGLLSCTLAAGKLDMKSQFLAMRRSTAQQADLRTEGISASTLRAECPHDSTGIIMMVRVQSVPRVPGHGTGAA
jgi:hypothetical protein